MAKKINTAVLKEFLFNHGEKVALGTCAFLAVLFGVMGLLHAMGAGKVDGSSKTYVEEFTSNGTRVKQSMAAQGAPVLSDNVKKMMDPKQYDWRFVKSDYETLPYTITAEPNTSKRSQPMVLPILAKGSKQIQMDYLRALAFVHEVEQGQLLCLEPADDAKGQPADQPKGPKGPKGRQPQGSTLIPPVMCRAEPVRMVVVSAVFPMRKQVEEFQKALRIASQEDLFKLPREDLPYILGINVIKFEIVNNKPVDEKGEVLIYVDWTSKDKVKDKQVEKSKALDELLRTAIYDEETPELLKEHLCHGLTTPLPKLANARYPKFNFEGIDYAYFPDDEEVKKAPDVNKPPKNGKGLPGVDRGKGKFDPMNPKGNDPKQPEIAFKVKPISHKILQEADPVLDLRLFPKEKENAEIVNKYNIFHALGAEAPAKEDGVVPPGNGRNPPGNNMGGKKGDPNSYFAAWDYRQAELPPAPKKGQKADPNEKPAFPNWDRDALVRFVDPGAVPGKTYQYAVQVRMANPNFGKKTTEVAFGDLARLEELPPSSWVYTPTITIPAEYFLYAVDQKRIDDLRIPNNPNNRPAAKLDKNHTAFQLHQWTPQSPIDVDANGPEVPIGDWVIAERIVVRCGESIGTQVDVRVPIWVKIKNAFEMPVMKIVEGKTKKDKPGFKFDFKKLEKERPILVDFVGGKEFKNNKLDEETAVDALVLTADGKLTVLNSRAGEFAEQPDLPIPVTRQTRVERARITADAVNPPDAAINPKGGGRLPGVGGR